MANRTVKTTFKRADGTPRKGYVSFAPNVELHSTAGDTAIASEYVVVELDQYGRLSISLMTTDTEGVSPVGWSYTVIEYLDGAGSVAYNIMVPSGKTPLDLQNLADIVRV